MISRDFCLDFFKFSGTLWCSWTYMYYNYSKINFWCTHFIKTKKNEISSLFMFSKKWLAWRPERKKTSGEKKTFLLNLGFMNFFLKSSLKKLLLLYHYCCNNKSQNNVLQKRKINLKTPCKIWASPLRTIITILLTLWNSEQKNGQLV